MLNIPGHKGIANQKHGKILLHSCLEWLPSRTQTTTNVRVDMGKKESSYNAGGNAN
jgi:hypothetical protein